MTVKKNHLSLYLKNYAEKKSLIISQSIPTHLQFKYTLIIPAYDETIDFLKKLHGSKLAQYPLLIILIINQPNNIGITHHNQILWDKSKRLGSTINSEEHYHLSCWADTNTYLLTVDCFSKKKQLPPKQAVGLARKIGSDIACALIEKKIILSHWVHTSDADTHLPNDYFVRTPCNGDYSACVYPFKHEFNSDTTCNEETNSADVLAATSLYETALCYYVDGLDYANSPYAYHSLGSCIAFNAFYYAQARGFPKRAAGEDFYLLNKLNKLAKIKQLMGKPLLITTRLSDRVPFGTGPAVRKMIEHQSTIQNYLYYHPQIFRHLREVLQQCELLFSAKLNLEEWLKKLPTITQEALIELKIHSLFNHIETQIKNKEQCEKQVQNWFDAFKTLKFIRHLDQRYKSIPLKEGIKILSATFQDVS